MEEPIEKAKKGSDFAQFVLDEIDKHFQPRNCTSALTGRNDNPSYASN